MNKDEIKDAFKEALEEHHTAFYVEAEKHYQHHQQMEICQASKPEWEANHNFMSDVRRTGSKAKGVVVTTVSNGLVVALLGALWYAVVHFFKVSS